MEFKSFLLNENKAYLVERIGDILNAIQDLNQNSDGMGVRQLITQSQTIVNQMRRIIHTHWPDSEKDKLKTLQKCGVAIMKTIEEKGDLRSVLSSCEAAVANLVGEEDTPINNIGTEQES
jgi:hypothetical protein